MALLIDKNILELLSIGFSTPLKLTTDGRNLLITPLSDSDKEKIVMKSAEKIGKRFNKVFKKLAD